MMKDILNNILASFNNNKDGYSSRKLTAFIIVLCVVAIHIKYIALADFSSLEMVLTIDFAFISALFGMTTFESIKKKPSEG